MIYGLSWFNCWLAFAIIIFFRTYLVCYIDTVMLLNRKNMITVCELRITALLYSSQYKRRMPVEWWKQSVRGRTTSLDCYIKVSIFIKSAFRRKKY